MTEDCQFFLFSELKIYFDFYLKDDLFLLKLS